MIINRVKKKMIFVSLIFNSEIIDMFAGNYFSRLLYKLQVVSVLVYLLNIKLNGEVS